MVHEKNMEEWYTLCAINETNVSFMSTEKVELCKG